VLSRSLLIILKSRYLNLYIFPKPLSHHFQITIRQVKTNGLPFYAISVVADLHDDLHVVRVMNDLFRPFIRTDLCISVRVFYRSTNVINLCKKTLSYLCNTNLQTKQISILVKNIQIIFKITICISILIYTILIIILIMRFKIVLLFAPSAINIKTIIKYTINYFFAFGNINIIFDCIE
jgi:hypothetical protein